MKYIIANWKMKMNKNDISNWKETFNQTFNPENNKEVIIAPTVIHISDIQDLNQVKMATQDVSMNTKGSHTGDVGAFQIKEYCEYAIVGHSERKEPRDIVYKKRDVALSEGITPIVCFTELDQLKEAYVEGALVAWEDPENIATDGVFKPKDPQEIVKMYNEFSVLLPNINVIYGGSVNRDNIGNLISINNFGGVLLGTASLDPIHFIDIYKAI